MLPGIGCGCQCNGAAAILVPARRSSRFPAATVLPSILYCTTGSNVKSTVGPGLTHLTQSQSERPSCRHGRPLAASIILPLLHKFACRVCFTMVENAAVAACLLGGEGDDGNISGKVKARYGGGSMVYLNNAAQARLSCKVKEAGVAAVEAEVTPNADEDQGQIRSLFADLIGADDAADIAIHPSTAFAITFAAENIYAQWRRPSDNGGNGNKRCNILVLEDQYPSAVYPWQRICHKSSGTLKLLIVPYPSSNSNNSTGGWTEAVLQRLDDNVVAACLPPLHWSDGALLDLREIGKACKKMGVPLIVDSTQATGILPFGTVRDIGPTMLACSAHKWLRGPSGASLVYVDPKLHGVWSPLDQHARGRDFEGGAEWDMGKGNMDSNGYPEKFYADARKYDSGGKANPILFPMLRAALEEVNTIDVTDAQKQLRRVTKPLFDWVAGRGGDYYELPSTHAYHLIGLRPKRTMTPRQMVEIATRLRTEDGICIAVRCGSFRISPYLDTIAQDIDKLVSALERKGL